MANEIAKLFVTLGLDDSDLQKGLKDLQKVMTPLAKGMLALGGALTAGLGLAVKAAEEERVGIMQLSSVLDNAKGVYANTAAEIENLIAAQQRQTGVTDGEQRQAMAALVVTTNDAQKAMSLLPLAMDLAAAKGMDLTTAAELVGKVAEGNTSILSRYGIQLRDGATASQALAELQDRVSGSAAAMASPFAIAKAGMSDMVETIGGALLPVFNSMLQKIIPIVQAVTDWIAQNPQMVEGIARFAAILVGAGGLIYALVAISKAIVAVNAALAILHGLSGPAGWAALAAGVALAAGAIWAISAMVPDAGGAMPSFAEGGIVPGPLGAPVPVMAHGGEAFAGVGKTFGGDNINITVNGWVGSDQQIARKIREQFLEIKRQTNSTGL